MTNAPEKLDRRKVRTRHALRDALLELIQEKGYEAITIADITDRANVARPTFYLHYKDKLELLFSHFRELYGELFQANHPFDMAEVWRQLRQPETADDADFRHVAEHADFYRVMFSEKGSIAFLTLVLDFLSARMESDVLAPMTPDDAAPRLPPGFIGAFLAGAELGVVNWWLKQDATNAHSPREMAAMMQTLAVLGLAWAMRQPPPPELLE